MSDPATMPPISPGSETDTSKGRFVCPFCGSINQDPQVACPRCGLMNDPATRQATRLRIGPWFVLQRKNAAAPGMRFSMLLSLVQKGQVTPMSIVRGPTTQQLWRFACQVKGLSREFGLCYGCGEEIEPTAHICPRCNRLQDPPADPNVLLEGSPGSASRPAAPAPPRPVLAESADEAFFEAVDGGKPGEETSDKAAPPPRKEPAAHKPAAVAPQPPQRPSPPPVEPPPGMRPAGEAFLSAHDLANAFKVNYEPKPHRRQIGGILKSVAAVLLIVIVGLAIVLYLDRDLRQQVREWAPQVYANVRQSLDDAWQRHEQEQRPPEATRQTPVPPSPDAVAQRPEPSPAERPELPPQPEPTPRTPLPPAHDELPDLEQRMRDLGIIDFDRPDRERTPEPEAPAETEPREAVDPPTAPPTQDPPAPEPPRVSQTRPDNRDTAPPVAMDRDEAIQESRRLWRAAIDAESRQDHREAVRLYEQIEQLPRDVWPAALELRLEAARARIER